MQMCEGLCLTNLQSLRYHNIPLTTPQVLSDPARALSRSRADSELNLEAFCLNSACVYMHAYLHSLPHWDASKIFSFRLLLTTVLAMNSPALAVAYDRSQINGRLLTKKNGDGDDNDDDKGSQS